MRRGLIAPALLVALLATSCGRPRKPEPAPEIVAAKAAGPDLARYRALAAGCGAASARVQTIDSATFITVGKDSSLAARDCFFEKVRADYRANHPVRAWIEDRIS